MAVLLSISMSVSVIVLAFYLYKEQKFSYISLPISLLINGIIMYPLTAEANFISKVFLMFIIVSGVIHIYLRYFQYVHYNIYVRYKVIHVLITLASNLLLPFVFLNAPNAVYQSAAYLSVSTFIFGLILYQLSEVDRPYRYFQIEKINTYQYIKNPKLIGEILFVVSYTLLTLFLPFWYVYLLFGVVYIIYIKRSLLFLEQ